MAQPTTEAGRITARKRKNLQRKTLLKEVKAKDAQTVRTKPTKAVAAGKCGAKRRDGAPCQMPAGQGTDHPGFGRCKHHGGAVPTHLRSYYKQQAIFMGAEKEINPLDAIMWCIRIKAGEV